MNLRLRLCVPRESLKEFFHSIISHSTRATVHKIFKGASLNWKAYWDIPKEARHRFTEALLWAQIYPTVQQVKRILLEEKRTAGSVTTLLYGSRSKWWIEKEPLFSTIKRAFKSLSLDEFQSIYKSIPIYSVVVYASHEQLPLVVGDKRLDHWDKYLGEGVGAEFERRLKGGD